MTAAISKIGLAAELSTNQAAIDLAEEVLGRLRSGETIAFAVVEVRKARTVATGYVAADQYHLLNSGAARLAVRIASEVDDE